MGWLKDAASQAGVPSLAQLAETLCKAVKAPGDEKHVANMLRKLDREEDLSWWDGKGRRLLAPLAEVLGEDEDDLRARIAGLGQSGAEAGRYWTFDVFPALRALDLDTDPLPPGIPRELLEPARQPRWWHAPAGSGRTMLGRALERRGWTFLQRRTWHDAERALPETGRVYVELAEPSSPPVKFKVAEELRLIVAAPPVNQPRDDDDAPDWVLGLRATRRRSGPPAEAPPPPFRDVHSAPPQVWLRPLLRWVAARVKPGGGFDAAAVEPQLAGDVGEAFQTVGDCLAFLGLVDRIGIDELFSRQDGNPERWARAWLRAALDRRDRRLPGGAADLLRREGAEMLVQMEISRVRLGDGPSLPAAVWERHVPPALAPVLDRERLLALADDRDALKAALAAPTATEVIAALVEVGVLAGEPQLSLSPGWLGWVVSALAEERLGKTVEGMGALFLARESAPRLLAKVVREVESGRLERVEAVLASGCDTPERLAALDGAVRAVGLALARGATVGVDVVRRVWERQRFELLERWTNSPPVPLVRIADAPRAGGMSGYGEWVLAALAITRVLPEVTGPYAVWHGVSEEADREQLTTAVRWLAQVVPPQTVSFAEELDRDDGAGRLALAAFAMGPALLRAAPHLGAENLVFRVLDPAVLLARVTSGEEPSTDRVEGLPFGLEVLDHVCAAEGVNGDEVIRWCWATWTSAAGSSPLLTWARAHRDGWVRRLLANRPSSVSLGPFRDAVLGCQKLWPLLSETNWTELLAGHKLDSLPDTGVWEALPAPVLVELLRGGRASPSTRELRRQAWARARPEVLALVDDWARAAPGFPAHYAGDPGPLADMLYSAPPDANAELIERASRWLEQPETFAGVKTVWLQRWLAHLVDGRGPSWRRAFELVRSTPFVPTSPPPSPGANPDSAGARRRSRGR